MTDRAHLLESALNALPEGLALVDTDGHLAFWNVAAEAITGRTAPETIGRNVREVLDALVVGGAAHWISHADAGSTGEHGGVVQLRHKLGVEFPVVARPLVLRDALGSRLGTGVLFHAVEKIDALPLGDGQRERSRTQSSTELENRLARMHEDFRHGDGPLGVMWVTVDQGPALRRSHGARACEAMLEQVEKTLASGLKPAEEIGRWSEQDFLILSHERSAVALTAHAQSLAGLARTTEFRWWGDRISLTVSVGAAQALEDESLCTLLERAEAAMLASMHAGGNQTTAARGNG